MGSVLRGSAIASTTRTSYRVHWEQWQRFARYMKWSEWLSTDEKDNSTKLGLFVIYCWRYGWHAKQRGNQYGTIQLRLSSIRWYHKTYAGTKIKHSPDFDVLMRGIQRVSDPLLKKQPITPAFLRLLFRRLDFTRPRSRLLWGAVLLAYFFPTTTFGVLASRVGSTRVLSHGFKRVLFQWGRGTCSLQKSGGGYDWISGRKERSIWTWSVENYACHRRQGAMPHEGPVSSTTCQEGAWMRLCEVLVCESYGGRSGTNVQDPGVEHRSFAR